ncbi:Pleckstrin y domain-containing family F member 2 [Portunus trituberculatus]|uniref:Pleckstrin y domain-containing family F member 2 n=1 Tax=Portunus trituberculatus TaxID=210409 RepID=A0A5B7KD68_PORTR|nr:Pleckstrin y domain-containing family F member 2 [Portunus trituberculatus]
MDFIEWKDYSSTVLPPPHTHTHTHTVPCLQHHCRKCGKVVCGPCSSKKVILQHQSSKPLRVCLSCHDEISSAQTQPNDSGNLNTSQYLSNSPLQQVITPLLLFSPYLYCKRFSELIVTTMTVIVTRADTCWSTLMYFVIFFLSLSFSLLHF